jgi:Tol biopolymer transport system component
MGDFWEERMYLSSYFNKVTLVMSGIIVSFLLSTNVYAGSKNGIISYHCFDTSVPPVSPLNICYINTDGSGQVQVTFGTLSFLPWWSPDGQQLAYTSIDFLHGGRPKSS